MPTYEYECKSCRYDFDAFQSIKDEPLKVCPKCGKELRRLIQGGTGIIFKGNGFYSTDKGKKTETDSAGKTEGTAGSKPADTGTSSAEHAKPDAFPKAAS